MADERKSDAPEKGKLSHLSWFINKVGFPTAMVVAMAAWIWYRESRTDEQLKLVSEMRTELRELNKTTDKMLDRLERMELSGIKRLRAADLPAPPTGGK